MSKGQTLADPKQLLIHCSGQVARISNPTPIPFPVLHLQPEEAVVSYLHDFFSMEPCLTTASTRSDAFIAHLCSRRHGGMLSCHTRMMRRGGKCGTTCTTSAQTWDIPGPLRVLNRHSCQEG